MRSTSGFRGRVVARGAGYACALKRQPTLLSGVKTNGGFMNVTVRAKGGRAITVMMDKPLICELDKGTGTGRFGVALFRAAPGEETTRIDGYQGMMRAIRSDEHVRAIVHLSSCSDAKTKKDGPSLITSVDLHAIEQFNKHTLYPQSLDYLVAATSPLVVGKDRMIQRRYIKASSAKSVGVPGFWKLSKGMIEGNLGVFEELEAIRFSYSDFVHVV